MVQEFKVNQAGFGFRVGIIVSRYNEFIGARLLKGALETLRDHGVRDEDVTVVWVPGALELPQAAKWMAIAGRWDTLVALGAVIRGETIHFSLVATESARGIAEIARQTGMPISFGVLVVDTVEQASERAGGRLGNRGTDAASTAIQMANLFHQLNPADSKRDPLSQGLRGAKPSRKVKA